MGKEKLEMQSGATEVGEREPGPPAPRGLLGGGMPQGGTGEPCEPVPPEGRPPPSSRKILPPDPEVDPRPQRRRFTAQFKRKVLADAERCSRPGDIGALLRRQGLYSSHLVVWRRQQEEGMLAGLAPRRRGRKPEPKNPLAERVAKLERENALLEKRLRHAQAIMDLQKKVSELLGIPLTAPGNEGIA